MKIRSAWEVREDLTLLLGHISLFLLSSSDLCFTPIVCAGICSVSFALIGTSRAGHLLNCNAGASHSCDALRKRTSPQSPPPRSARIPTLEPLHNHHPRKRNYEKNTLTSNIYIHTDDGKLQFTPISYWLLQNGCWGSCSAFIFSEFSYAICPPNTAINTATPAYGYHYLVNLRQRRRARHRDQQVLLGF